MSINLTIEQSELYRVQRGSKIPLCGSELARRTGMGVVPAYREIHELIKAGLFYRTTSGAFITDEQATNYTADELTPLDEALHITKQPETAIVEHPDDVEWFKIDLSEDDESLSPRNDTTGVEVTSTPNPAEERIKAAQQRKQQQLWNRIEAIVQKTKRPLDSSEIARRAKCEWHLCCHILNELYRAKKIKRTHEAAFCGELCNKGEYHG